MTLTLVRAGVTLAAALVTGLPVHGQGQQSGKPAPTAAAPATSRPSGQAPSGQTPSGQTPSPSAQTPRASRESRPMPQGFSIVLVLADLQAAPGEDDVPPAARKALLDMKDFLPYKSYRLLDAAWVLCCGTGRTVSRLRGPDEREYEVELMASPSPTSQVSVQFLLRDLDGGRNMSATTSSRNSRDSIAVLEQQLAEAKTRLAPDHPQVLALQKRLEDARVEVARAEAVRIENEHAAAEARAQRSASGSATASGGRRSTNVFAVSPQRAMMNTTFTMDLGETVVVGTSRLTGNNKALIALLTAVPQRPPRR